MDQDLEEFSASFMRKGMSINDENVARQRILNDNGKGGGGGGEVSDLSSILVNNQLSHSCSFRRPKHHDSKISSIENNRSNCIDLSDQSINK